LKTSHNAKFSKKPSQDPAQRLVFNGDGSCVRADRMSVWRKGQAGIPGGTPFDLRTLLLHVLANTVSAVLPAKNNKI